MGSKKGELLCLEGTTMDARLSMLLVDEVILALEYQTGTAIHDSFMNRSICDDLDVRCGMEAWA